MEKLVTFYLREKICQLMVQVFLESLYSYRQRYKGIDCLQIHQYMPNTFTYHFKTVCGAQCLNRAFLLYSLSSFQPVHLLRLSKQMLLTLCPMKLLRLQITDYPNLFLSGV